MRAVGVHPDAVVVTSRMWQTTCTAIRARRRGDADRLAVLPGRARRAARRCSQQAGFEISALLATHADYDHLLGRAAFPGLALGVGRVHRAPPARRAGRGAEGAPRRRRRALRRARPRRSRSARTSRCRCRATSGLGDEELELHPAEGHTADGTAVFARWAGVLCVGDYLSDVEIPIVHDLDEYRATLARLAPLVEAAEAVVPGHGSPHDRDTALRLLDEDLEYLDGLRKLPAGRETKRQREIHEANLTLVRIADAGDERGGRGHSRRAARSRACRSPATASTSAADQRAEHVAELRARGARGHHAARLGRAADPARARSRPSSECPPSAPSRRTGTA